MPHKKTILFRVWKFPITSETFILAQIITALNCGFTVRVLVEELQGIDATTHKILLEKYNILEKIIIEDHRIPRKKILRWIKAAGILILNLQNIFSLMKFLNKETSFLAGIYSFQFFKKFNGYDIVHVQYGTNVKPLDRLKRSGLFFPKLIVSFHGHDLYFPINGRIPNNGYYDDVFANADRLIANTPYLKNLLLQYGAPSKKINTIPVAVDTLFFTPKKANRRKSEVIRLITVGRLEIFKGQRYGIESVKKLIEKGYKVSYTIVGSGSQYEVLKDLINTYQLNEHIALVGKKSQREIRDMLREHDVFLMTSVTDPDYGVESQGLVSAEAQACGLPVIAFDSGGVKYTVEDGVTGYVVPETQVETMVEKIEILIHNQKLRKSMGEEAVLFVQEKFSRDRITEVWCKVYNELNN